jgi:hypothetical protein
MSFPSRDAAEAFANGNHVSCFTPEPAEVHGWPEQPGDYYCEMDGFNRPMPVVVDAAGLAWGPACWSREYCERKSARFWGPLTPPEP